MRALWFVRKNLEQHSGGDTTQILRTQAALEQLGVQIERTSNTNTPLAGFDVVHLFHLDRLWEHLELHARLRRANIPVVLSTIYWPSDEFDRNARMGIAGMVARTCGSAFLQWLRVTGRFIVSRPVALLTPWKLTHSFRSRVCERLASVAVLLPNSETERVEIEQRFGLRRPAIAVPNAVEAADFERPPDCAAERKGVLCVGRIEPRKNQLKLIEALRGSDVQLTLVGKAGRFSERYYNECRNLAANNSNVRLIDQRSPSELARLYWSALAHACVSWYETPGLASLEAGLCGCRLVITDKGSTRDYFGGDADYCEPDSAESIRSAIENALQTPPSTSLAERIRHDYTWENAAKRTLEGYELAVQLAREQRGTRA